MTQRGAEKSCMSQSSKFILLKIIFLRLGAWGGDLVVRVGRGRERDVSRLGDTAGSCCCFRNSRSSFIFASVLNELEMCSGPSLSWRLFFLPFPAEASRDGCGTPLWWVWPNPGSARELIGKAFCFPDRRVQGRPLPLLLSCLEQYCKIFWSCSYFVAFLHKHDAESQPVENDRVEKWY